MYVTLDHSLIHPIHMPLSTSKHSDLLGWTHKEIVLVFKYFVLTLETTKKPCYIPLPCIWHLDKRRPHYVEKKCYLLNILNIDRPAPVDGPDAKGYDPETRGPHLLPKTCTIGPRGGGGGYGFQGSKSNPPRFKTIDPILYQLCKLTVMIVVRTIYRSRPIYQVSSFSHGN